MKTAAIIDNDRHGINGSNHIVGAGPQSRNGG